SIARAFRSFSGRRWPAWDMSVPSRGTSPTRCPSSSGAWRAVGFTRVIRRAEPARAFLRLRASASARAICSRTGWTRPRALRKLRGTEAWCLRLLGEIASHRGPPEIESAKQHYHQGLALAAEVGMRPLAAHCHLGLGKLSRRTGTRVQAQEHLATARTMYREM